MGDQGTLMMNYFMLYVQSWASIQLPYGTSFDIPAVTLRFELESRSVVIRPLKPVDLGFVIPDGFPQTANCILEVGIIIGLSLEDHHLAGGQFNQIKSFWNLTVIIEGNFNTLGIQGCAWFPQVFRQPHAYRLVECLFYAAKNIPYFAVHFLAIFIVIARLDAALEDQLPGGTVHNLDKNNIRFLVFRHVCISFFQGKGILMDDTGQEIPDSWLCAGKVLWCDPELFREGTCKALVGVEDEIESHIHDPDILRFEPDGCP